jgi:hypothetical protein
LPENKKYSIKFLRENYCAMPLGRITSEPRGSEFIQRFADRDKENAMTRGSAVLLALLIAGGFLGNYFAYPLFFGADFLFGSIAVLLVHRF